MDITLESNAWEVFQLAYGTCAELGIAPEDPAECRNCDDTLQWFNPARRRSATLKTYWDQCGNREKLATLGVFLLAVPRVRALYPRDLLLYLLEQTLEHEVHADTLLGVFEEGDLPANLYTKAKDKIKDNPGRALGRSPDRKQGKVMSHPGVVNFGGGKI